MKDIRAHFTHLFTAQEARKAAAPAGLSDPAPQARAHTDPPQSASGAGSSSATDLPPPYERDVLAAILELLAHHPRVAWAQRMNTGAMELPNPDGTRRRVRFAFVGCSDIIGQLRCGRFLAIEVKRKGKNPTDDQRAFLLRVNAHRGMGFVARSVDDVTTMLARLP